MNDLERLPAPGASDAELDRQACAMARNRWSDGQIAGYFSWPMERVYAAYKRHLAGVRQERAA